MEQYQSMAESIEKLKRPLVYIALVSVVTHLLILGTGIMANRQDEAKYMSVMEACHYGMKSLFENNPKETLFNTSVLKDVKDHTFKVEDIGLIKVLGGHRCDVIAKDAKGHRSFLVTLEKNSSFPHFYKIADVKEQKLVSKYQWRASL